MTAVLQNGQKTWELSRDEQGYRKYIIKWGVIADILDGPNVVLNCAGLPAVGSSWNFDNDVDAWAFCTPECKVTPLVSNEKNRHWEVEQTFSNAPVTRCQTETIEDPLDEPDRVSGSFVKYTKEAVKQWNPATDAFDKYILNSSFEQIRGAVVERDFNRPTVRIEKNLSTLPLSTFAPMIDFLNDATLWGLPARCVKLSNVSWERKIYGTCYYYYVVSYEFDINYESFDRILLDEGTRKLAPGGTVGNPKHYVNIKDDRDEDVRMLLDGSGGVWDGTGGPAFFIVRPYGEVNLLLLGIPTSF